jgi:hypothetical protein
MNPEIEPKQAFQRLFGGGTTAEALAAQAKRDHYDQSVLDLVQDQAKSLETKLGTTDRRKLDEYFTSIRDVERRIQMNGEAPPVVPAGAMGDLNGDYSFESHMKLMFDLMALSFQTDTTRVSTFLVSHDGGNRPYPFIGVAQGHHHISHHRNQPDALARLAIIDNFHVKQFAYFLNKLKSIKEGEGTLLDNSMIVFGGGISDGNSHSHDDLPTILAPFSLDVAPVPLPRAAIYSSMVLTWRISTSPCSTAWVSRPSDLATARARSKRLRRLHRQFSFTKTRHQAGFVF